MGTQRETRLANLKWLQQSCSSEAGLAKYSKAYDHNYVVETSKLTLCVKYLHQMQQI